MGMFRHYIRIAIRNLARQKLLSVINVVGLSIGLACFCLILIFSVSEFSYDRFHKKAARIYRTDFEVTFPDGKQKGSAGTPMPMGPALKKDFGDVEEFARVSSPSDMLMKGNNAVVKLPMTFADEGFFSMFSFPLLAGDPAQALKGVYNIVLTRSKAIQLFGTADAVGKTVQIRSDTTYRPFVVTAVAEDIPVNSSISFDVMGSFNYLVKADSNRQSVLNNWYATFGDETYVLLRPESRLAGDSLRLGQFYLRYFPPAKPKSKGSAKIVGAPVAATLGLQPLTAIHTSTSVSGGGPSDTTTDPRNIWILLGIAAGILLIASINFTTLAVARSAGRAREIGVRKVVGSLRRQLIAQFLMESFMQSVISTVLGLLIAVALLPWFSQLSGRPLELSFTRFPELTWLLLATTGVVGLLAGFYPAMVLSGFNPVEVLRSRVKLGGSNYFTRGLVTLQFVLSIGLVTATVIILQQVHYMRSRDLGMIKENTVVIHTQYADASKIYPVLRTELAADKSVMGIAGTQMVGLGEGQPQMGDAFEFNDMVKTIIQYPVDADFIPVMGMRLLAGRNFDPAITSDTVGNVIVNETFARNELGLGPRQAIGHQFKSARGNDYKTIIGVVRDFNFERLNRKVRSQLFFMPAQFAPASIFVHLSGGDPTPAIAAMRSAWNRLAPDVPFQYSFLDEDLDRFYKSEARWGDIIACAGGISVFLATLGLMGLAALAAANRIKEIGIRRVLGASPIGIVTLLTGGFLRLVLLAALIAAPLAWYFMHQWLQDYAYRINIPWWTFVLTSVAALTIAYLTIGAQALRATRAKPVENLRTE
jgi:putative ABC transport system permease protein